MRAEPEIDAAPSDRVLEVVVQWGQSVLYAEHVRAPGELLLGEHSEAGEPRESRESGRRLTQAAFALDLAHLGVDALVLARHDGERASLLVPSALGARAVIDGVALDASELGPDGYVALPEGASAEVELCGLIVRVRATTAPRDTALRAARSARLTQPWTLASLGAHLFLLGLFYVLPPHSQALNVNDVDLRGRLVRFTLEARSREPEPPVWTKDEGPEGEGAPGQPAKGPEGAIGDPKAPKAPRRAASRGDSPTPSLATAPIDARDAGILGLLRAAAPGAVSAFTADAARGSDDTEALGVLLADRLGASFGQGGLGMIGIGKGGGGDGTGTVGLGALGTIGVGQDKQGGGYGTSGGGLGPRAGRVPPRLIAEPPEVRGGLSKEVIRRVVRRHLSEVRYCYEQRLLTRPDLQGRVAVRFVIGSSGAVMVAGVLSSTLEDARASKCIVEAVQRWSFPVPDGGGIVSVTYPFVLQHTAP